MSFYNYVSLLVEVFQVKTSNNSQDIESLIPYKVNSVRDNFGQVEIQIVFKAFRWGCVIKYWYGIFHSHLHKTFMECRMSFVRYESSFYWKYWFSIKAHSSIIYQYKTIELQHDKTIKMACAPSQDSDQPGHHPVWSESWLFAKKKVGSLATH